MKWGGGGTLNSRFRGLKLPMAGAGIVGLARVGLASSIISLLAACALPAQAPATQTPVPAAALAPMAPLEATALPTPNSPVATPTAIVPAAPTPTLASASPTAAAPAAVPTVAPPPPSPSPTNPPAASPPSDPAVATNTGLWQGEAADLAQGTLTGLTLAGDAIVLAKDVAGRVMKTGTLVSTESPGRFDFDNAVLSWNAQASPGTSLRFELRAKAAGGWSPWYLMGTWDGNGGASQRGQSDSFGSVNVDTLALKNLASAWQYRVTLASDKDDVSPALRRVAIVYANLRRPLAGPAVAATSPRDLPVPAFSQLEQDSAIARQICSPTSLAMVLNYYGIKTSVAQVAKGVRDGATGIFGNWPLNTAYAGSLGMDAYVDRFYSMGQIQSEIAAGRPVILSINFTAGQLRNSPIASTSGHLIVARGFTAEGNVIVNDPIASTAAEVRRVYDRKELEKVWLAAGGVVYLVRPT